jgi:NADH:ubiquinone oxidoreductase subunit 3 (subunit A)
MLGQYGYVGILLLVALIFPLGAVVTSFLLGKLRIRPSAPDPVKEDTYESGVQTEGPAWVQFNFRYYLYALLFVVFDVEAVFLFPWAVAFDQLPAYMFLEVLLFLGILVLGLVYEWRKRALEWL